MEQDENFSLVEREVFEPMRAVLGSINIGDNLLIDTGDRISILKYEGSDLVAHDRLSQRVSRHTNVICLGNIIRPYWAFEGEGKEKWDEMKDNHRFTHKDPSKRIIKQLRADFLGTHKIDFVKDEEFGIYLVSSENTDTYLNIANKFADDKVKKVYDTVELIADDNLIKKRLQEITRPGYFEENIIPYLESRHTKHRLPDNNQKKSIVSNALRVFKSENGRPNYLRFDRRAGWKWFDNVASKLEHGDFIYSGCKEEVYLLGVSKPDGEVYYQGTYTTSTKPILFFSNNVCGFMGAYEVKKILLKEDVIHYDIAKYRTQEPPSFDGEYFIFSAIGRTQNCKNSIFTGEPDIITGDLEEALSHFETTDFKEFKDVVRKYAENIRKPTPSSMLDPGREFFY